MNKMRNIKLMVLAAIAAGALAVPAIGSAAGPTAPVTAAGITVKACEGEETGPLLIFVRGVGCDSALDLTNEASSGDGPCPEGWHGRHVRLKAEIGGKNTAGPFVFLCTQKAGQRAFTYRPIGG
jgi:hypothetical protein